MPATFEVHTIRLGTIRADKSGTVYGYPLGTVLDVPVWAAAIEGAGRKILVDTGIRDAAKWSRVDPHTIAPEETIDAALAELGWRRRDVDTVINTHLHYDHAENNLAFPHAQFYVSHEEWQWAADPSSAQAWAYDIEWTDDDLTVMNYHLVSRDHYDVVPGLRIIQTPGHTPGHQSVLVRTAEGVLCVSGDAACMMENLTTPTPPGTHVGSAVSLASLKKISDVSDRILMNHDPDLSRFQSSGFPLTPQVQLP
ncbi:N-acyl homoserine lactonase family protein [Pedococcus sp. 5OH_020]|uniref:N-acyl homoserine lactonase family protein n=1 Tax=Pedococcus sp. 5OH_020 TaxID=2989814 RepID=UPI0022EA0B55|nr:N-acyl homoserine lactonase family protein [Pedococcus sp. 5OH_020]